MSSNWLGFRSCAGFTKHCDTASRRARSRCSSSSHFPPMPYSKLVKPVTLPPGRARLATKPAADRIAATREHDRHGAGQPCCNAPTARRRCGHDDVGAARPISSQHAGSRSTLLSAQRYSIATFRPSTQPASCSPCRNAASDVPEIPHRRQCSKKADHRHALGLLRPRRERPRRRRAAEQRDELAPL